MTRVIRVDANAPDAEAIARAAACVRGGGLVAFPTETVYGLGAHALDADAVQRLFVAKGRPADDPLIVHVPSLDRLVPLTRELPDAVARLADRFWPGPLTLVLPRSSRVPDAVTAGLDTVAIRVPAHPVARALLWAADVPIAAPSANLFSRPSPTRAAHVLEDLGGRIDIVLDAGATELGLESTVLDVAHAVPTVLRPGAVTLEQLRSVVPDVARGAGSIPPEGTPLASPGMLARHYSPRAPLTLYEGDATTALSALQRDLRTVIASGARVGILAPRETVASLRASLGTAYAELQVIDVGPATDLPGIAAALYDGLRKLDSTGVDLILARGVAAQHGLGAAISDRLRRAAAGRIVSS